MNRRFVVTLAAGAALAPVRGRAQLEEADAARVLRRFWEEVYIPQDLTAFEDLVAENVAAQDATDVDGRDAWAQRLRDEWRTLNGLATWEIEVVDVFGCGTQAGARLAVRYRAYGFDPEQTGDVVSLCAIAAGKIVRYWGATALHKAT
jgi:hypothetical protein